MEWEQQSEDVLKFIPRRGGKGMGIKETRTDLDIPTGSASTSPPEKISNPKCAKHPQTLQFCVGKTSPNSSNLCRKTSPNSLGLCKENIPKLFSHPWPGRVLFQSFISFIYFCFPENQSKPYRAISM